MGSNDYLSSLTKWRGEMERNLRADYSWLALWGLFWLEEGENTIGSADGSRIKLPDRIPAHLGVFTLREGKVSLQVAEDDLIRLNDWEPITPDHVLKADISGEANFLFTDDVRMMLIERGGELAVRVWDPLHPNRMNFVSRQWFDTAKSLRVKARIEVYDPPKAVLVDDILGFQHEAEMHAALVFELDGQEQRLDAELLSSGAYYIIFKDETAGKSTYPAGRYLVSEIAEDDHVVIDFNRAYNPPCAFTDHATCPLPRPENVLDIAIEAGEKY